MKKGLILAILAAIASWGVQHAEHGHNEWLDLLDPLHCFSLLGVVVSVWWGWSSGVRIGRRTGDSR